MATKKESILRLNGRIINAEQRIMRRNKIISEKTERIKELESELQKKVDINFNILKEEVAVQKENKELKAKIPNKAKAKLIKQSLFKLMCRECNLLEIKRFAKNNNIVIPTLNITMTEVKELLKFVDEKWLGDKE